MDRGKEEEFAYSKKRRTLKGRKSSGKSNKGGKLMTAGVIQGGKGVNSALLP